MTREMILEFKKFGGNTEVLAIHAEKLHNEVQVLKQQLKNIQIELSKTDRQIVMLLDPCSNCGVNPKHLRLAFCSDCYSNNLNSKNFNDQQKF